METEQFLKADFIDFVMLFIENNHSALIDPCQFAQDLWDDCQVRQRTFSDSAKLRSFVYQQYSVLVYDGCRNKNAGNHERAWQTLRQTLVKAAHHKMPTFVDWEESVQESLILAYTYIQENRVKKPEQFLNLTRTFLFNHQIDTIRRQRAKKRGNGMVGSLEAVVEKSQRRMRMQKNFRSTEQNALHTVAKETLAHSFQTFLKTHNQKQVARMYFFECLKPREIAHLMEKTPHQIRQTVSRVKKEIEQFPPSATKWFPVGD